MCLSFKQTLKKEVVMGVGWPLLHVFITSVILKTHLRRNSQGQTFIKETCINKAGTKVHSVNSLHSQVSVLSDSLASFLEKVYLNRQGSVFKDFITL